MGQSMNVEFDDSRFAAIEIEAQRLGLTAEQVIDRACAAWLLEQADNTALLGDHTAQQPNA